MSGEEFRSMFRNLSPTEEQEFRQWARENWKPGMVISSVWHPVVQDECALMLLESFEKPVQSEGEK